MEDLLEKININPRIMGGKPVIKGTRVAVSSILRRLAYELSVEEVLKDYPYLEKEDIMVALLYAAEVLEGKIQVKANEVSH